MTENVGVDYLSGGPGKASKPVVEKTRSDLTNVMMSGRQEAI